MKKCPICSATSFDDADVCYGCLHHFQDDSLDDVAMPASSSGPCGSAERGAAEGVELPIVVGDPADCACDAGDSWNATASVEDGGRTIIVRLHRDFAHEGVGLGRAEGTLCDECC